MSTVIVAAVTTRTVQISSLTEAEAKIISAALCGFKENLQNSLASCELATKLHDELVKALRAA